MARALNGRVVANQAPKTATVEVEQVKVHRIYGKRYTTSKRYLVHDAEDQLQVGDWVRIREGRPMSKRKRWQLEEVLSSGVQA